MGVIEPGVTGLGDIVLGAGGPLGGLQWAAPQAESIEVTVLEATSKGSSGLRSSATTGTN